MLIVSAIIALFSWTYFARLVRGQVLSLREREFIEAARSLGAGPLRIMFTDILPNLTGPILVFVTLQIPVNIVLEATLSFLGVGVQPPTPTWGNMLAEAQSNDTFQTNVWSLLGPSLALLITVLAFNLFGDGLRDASTRGPPARWRRADPVVAFVLRRLGYMVLVLFVIAVVAFGLSSIANNDPAALLAPRGANAAAIAQIRVNLHLNDPLYLQFWHFLTRGPEIRGTPTGLMHWPPSLGYSFQQERPVTAILEDRLPATLSLAIGAAVIWLAIALRWACSRPPSRAPSATGSSPVRP